MHLLYDLILLLFVLAMVPVYLLRSILQGKLKWGIRERFGLCSQELIRSVQGRDVVWIHAASVGETFAALSLIRGLRHSFPGAFLLLSTTTETGRDVAAGIRELDGHLLMPFDLSMVTRKVLTLIAPRFIVIVETEIWPNFLRNARQLGIPVIMANGRISDRSFPRYRRARPLVRPVLEKFTAFCMQSRQDADRIQLLGAPAERVTVTGNLKFDMKPVNFPAEDLREEFRIPADCPVWVAGSTHEGEEEIVLEVYRRLLADGQKLLLILVPRHPQRSRGVADKFGQQGWSITLRSAITRQTRCLQSGDVLLVDTVGELMKFYALAEVVFVGGSLVNVGGHNVLEGALLKKPVLFGPHMQNFKEISRLLLAAGGGRCIGDPEELFAALRELLLDPPMRTAMGQNGYALLEENRGASEQTLAVIDQVMKAHAATYPSAS